MEIRGTGDLDSETVEWDAVEGASGYRLTCELDDPDAVSAIMPRLCRWWQVEALGQGRTEAGVLWPPPALPEGIPFPDEASLDIVFGATTFGSGQSPATVTGAASLTATASISTSGTVALAGDLLYVHDYTAARGQATSPSYGWSWGVQYGGGQTTANMTIQANAIETGLPSAKITLAPYTSGTRSIEGLYKKTPLVIGEHHFYGVMFRFPSTWTTSPGSWGATIAQPSYQSFWSAAYGLYGAVDHVQLRLLTGKVTWSGPGDGNGNPSFEYNNSAELGPFPNGPRAIPESRWAREVWHQVIFEVVWAAESSDSPTYDGTREHGLTRIWHRQMGGSGVLGEWTKTIDLPDVPTLQWGYGATYGGTRTAPYMGVDGKTASGQPWTVSHKFGNYVSPGTSTVTMEHGNIMWGTTFDIVAAEMPDG